MVHRPHRHQRHLSRDGEIGAEEARHRARAFSVFIDADGTYVVRGRLEPEAGAVLMRAVEAASDALYRAEAPDARPRSRQRRADAIGLVAERALAAGLGAGERQATPSGTRAERYQVTVHTEMATLEKDGEGGRSELDGVRVSAETSRRMACDASLVSMLHRDGQVVSVGRKTRTIPPHIRRALEERDRGCRYPAAGAGSPRRIMSGTGPTAGRRVWPARCCCAGGITGSCTRAGSGWRSTGSARRCSSRAAAGCSRARRRCRSRSCPCRLRPRSRLAKCTTGRRGWWTRRSHGRSRRP